jgi:L-amino acid N-acyltransferase YncA
MIAASIRDAQPADAAAIAAIYGEHVRGGTATFDTEAPDARAWADKIAHVRGRSWPFIVAERDGALAGFAYATQFRDRPAYVYACENSVYISGAHHRRGIGRALLDRLVIAAEAAGFRQMIAVIGGGAPASVALHAACGFVDAGRMRSVGYKHGRWLDTVYMQRALGRGDSDLPATP